jgi:uncharacterized coiled-coil DUF342 family protein
MQKTNTTGLLHRGSRRFEREVLERLDKIERSLRSIKLQGVKTMAKVDELKTLITEVSANLAEIDGDIQEVLDKLAQANPVDGLTATETAEIVTMLTAVKDVTRATADKVPEPPAPTV